MFQLRFNHVFLGLMALGFLSAFVIPQAYSDRVRNLQGLFAPIARPAGAIASALHGKVKPAKITDERRDADIRIENQELKVEVSSLIAQLETLRKLDAVRESVGDVRSLCTPMSVLGSDPTGRDSLSLGAMHAGDLRPGMPVLFAGELIGLIDRAGIGGAQVRLVTDPGFRVIASFGRFVKKGEGQYEFRPAQTEPPLIQGLGKGMMVVRNVSLKDAKAQLEVGDWAVLNDSDYPPILAHRRIGKVTSIKQSPFAPLKAEIVLEPAQNLEMLREVMVMTRE